MNDMVERVARALREHWLEGDGPATMDAMAEIAIKAMREPTETMLSRGWDQTPCGWYGSAADDLAPVWQAMIDAAHGDTE